MNAVAVLGANGAIGGIAKRYFADIHPDMTLIVPSRAELDLSLGHELGGISVGSLDVIVLSVGSYSGLKGYVGSSDATYSDSFYANQKRFCEKYLKTDGLLINISSAALENGNNLSEDSPYFAYGKEKQAMETALSGISGIYTVHLRPTNILSPFENFDKSKHVFASMLRTISVAEGVCELWTSPADWREFTDSGLLFNCFDVLVRTYLSGNLSSRNIVLAVGSGVETNIVDLAKCICAAQKKQGVSFLALQPSRGGPLDETIGLSQLEAQFPDFSTSVFDLEGIVSELVLLYNNKRT